MALRQLYRDETKYRKLLEDIVNKESESPTRKYKQLSLLSQPERLRISTTVYADRREGRKDLVYPVDPTTKAEPEEVVVNVQGYAVRTNLPPITRKDNLPKNALSAKQSIVITGLGTKTFEQAARAVMSIRSMFASSLPEDTLLPWTPSVEGGHKCVEFSNRYFTGGNTTGLNVVDLDASVDPKGILTNLEVNGKHTDDNVVLYFERTHGANEKSMSYVPVDPVNIKPGQLVEVQSTFSVVPIGKGRHLMLCKLRSICILSKQVQDDADDALFAEAHTIQVTAPPQVKRKVGYADEMSDAEGSSVAMKRMRLDDTDEGDDNMKQG